MANEEAEPEKIVDLNEARAAKQALLWINALSGNKDGIYPTLANALVIFANDPVLAGLVGFDEFRSESMILRPPSPAQDSDRALPGPYPRVWKPVDQNLVQSYFQRRWSHRFNDRVVEQAMETSAWRNCYHPVCDYLSGLAWDGKPRIDTWFKSAFGTPDDDYHAAIGSKFLIGAVRRARQPGCKFDTMLVLEGDQNLGKSSAVKALFGDNWFTDSLPANFRERDSAIALRGVWCVEFGEIEHVIRNDVEVIKAFLSRQVDRYREINGKKFGEHPRQGVLIGTTNDRDYLRDASGNRRFWIVSCKFALVEWVAENRDQLWAEAAAREAAGETAFLEDADVLAQARRMQDDRMQRHPWADRVLEFLERRAPATTAEILSECLEMPVERQRKGHERDIGEIVRPHGWVNEKVVTNGVRKRRWARPSDEIRF